MDIPFHVEPVAMCGPAGLPRNTARCRKIRLRLTAFASVFDAIFAVEDEAPVPKLRRESSARIIDLAGFDPGRAVMIEDDVRDLEVPTEVGMATVWLCQQTGRPTPPSVDRRITRLTAFLDEIV